MLYILTQLYTCMYTLLPHVLNILILRNDAFLDVDFC